MRVPRVARLLGVLAFLAAGLTALSATTASAVPVVSTIMLRQAQAYTPHAPPGATDDYHCTLMNPHVTTNSYIISSQFFPGSPEDHHSILFLVPPNLAAAAEAANVGGNGWSCFGETPIPNTGLDQISNTPWLSAWSPGHGADNLPKDTGIYLPAGSLVVMQVHYNLLVGDKPVKNSLELHTVPATTPLLPLHLGLMPAPPDIPCAARRDRPAVQPGGVARQPGATIRAERRVLRGRPRVDLRAQSRRPARRRHHLVQLARRRVAATSCGWVPTCTCWASASR